MFGSTTVDLKSQVKGNASVGNGELALLLGLEIPIDMFVLRMFYNLSYGQGLWPGYRNQRDQVDAGNDKLGAHMVSPTGTVRCQGAGESRRLGKLVLSLFW